MEEQNVNNNIENTTQVTSSSFDVNNQTINTNTNINVQNTNNQVDINNINLTTPIDNNNQNINNSDNNTKEKSNKKIFIIFGTILAFVVIIIVAIILMFNLNKKKAYETVVNLGIDDYFKYVFSKEYEKDTNLLDINNEEQVYMYYYYNKNTKKYRINFEDPTFEGNLYLTYAKWDEYMDYHKKVFGVDSNHKMGMYDLNIDKIKLVEDDLYLLD